MKDITTKLLWGVFLCLLAVLLPHTAWLFEQFEPVGALGTGAAWAGAFAFESAIAVLVHKLAKHWEQTPRRATAWAKLSYRWLNAYVSGLAIAATVSALANLAHAVEFGKMLKIFTAWGIPAGLYQVAFGAVLPLVSLLFARVLSNETTSEEQPDPALEDAKRTATELRSKLRQAEAELQVANQRAQEAEARFSAAGDIFARLMASEKRERILAARAQWPALPAAYIAMVTATSQSYVSEILNEVEK